MIDGMAEKKGKTRADAVRQAVDQAFQTQVPRERIADLVDELGQTAGRLRGAVDDLRPATVEDLRAVRSDLAALAERVEALERAPAAKKRAPAKRATKAPDG
jgi:hypothetical protein